MKPRTMYSPATLAVLAACVIAAPTVDRLIDEALDDCWPDPTARYSVFRECGLVQVSAEEAVELGIPYKSLRGWSDLEECRFEWVDRRCLKRYRRKAGRR